MARTFGRVKAEAWDVGSEVRALTLEEQALYWMLISQPAVSIVGTLSYDPRRWSRLAEGLEREHVEELLDVLAARRFVIVDEEAGELLVRSFVKHNEPWKLPNLLTAARSEFRATESPAIREYLAERHPWLGDDSPREEVESYERDHAHSHARPNGHNHARSDAHSHGPRLARVDREGEGEALASYSLSNSPGGSAEGSARRQGAVGEPNGALPIAATCPMCGELHSVPLGWSLVDHLEDVHGVVDGAAYLASLEQGAA
jgi:hypothetical protein